MNRPIELALIVAGIDEEYQNSIIEGISSCAKEKNVNISCFAAFGGVISNSKYDLGEYNIYKLVNYDKLDGVILLTNTISDDGEKKMIIDSVKNAGIPTVVLDCDDYPEFYNVMIDNNILCRKRHSPDQGCGQQDENTFHISGHKNSSGPAVRLYRLQPEYFASTRRQCQDL